MNKVKIIFCTDGIFPYSIGGMQRHSRLLIEYLAKKTEVELVVVHPHNEIIFNEALKINEISIKPIDPRKNYLLECYRYSLRVYKIINKYSGHIVYSQGLCVWSNIKNIKQTVIVNPHGLEPYQAITIKEKILAIPFKIVFDYIFKNSNYIISLGGLLTKIINNRKSARTQVVILPNGVELRDGGSQDRPSKKETLSLLFIARFAQNKGINILLESIKELNEEGWADKLEFKLGGKGPLFEYYSSNYRYNNVHYLGFIPDDELSNLYKDSDVFVFPTLFEGMPTVVLEAMSYGLPIIVSNVGATAELVDNSNGYLIKKNSVKELKAAIIDFYFLDEKSKFNLSVSSSNKVVNNFNWDIISNKYIDLFKNICR